MFMATPVKQPPVGDGPTCVASPRWIPMVGLEVEPTRDREDGRPGKAGRMCRGGCPRPNAIQS